MSRNILRVRALALEAASVPNENSTEEQREEREQEESVRIDTGSGERLVESEIGVQPRRPSFSVVKTSTSHPDADGDGVADDPVLSPETVDYSVTVINDGNVTMSDVSVLDPLASGLVCSRSAPGVLAPGAQMVCTGSFVVDQAFIDAGSELVNTATAVAVGAGQEGSESDTYKVLLEQNRGVTVTKAPVEQSAVLGDMVDFIWQIQVTNTGNTTLTDILIEDGLIEDVDAPPTVIAA